MQTISDRPVILITGGSRGIGAATARLAARQGYDVAISYVSNEAAALAVAADVEAAGARALAVHADSADTAQVARLFDGIDHPEYVIQFVIQPKSKDDPRLAKFVDIYQHSPVVKASLDKTYGTLYQAGWGG